MSKKEKTDAHDALDVNVESSTRTIKAQFRRKAKALHSGRIDNPVSQKSFQELNEAYQALIQDRKSSKDLARKSVTILSSDVAGYSLMMANHEKETLEFFQLCKEVFEEIVEKNQGRVFNTAGDAILAEFDYVFSAVQCAVEIQKELRAINLGQPEGQKIQFRMGLNMGEVFIQDGDLLGDTVNIAARIQTAAKPGGICLSGGIYDLISNKVTHTFTSLGNLTFKNIPEPVRTFALTEDNGSFKPPLPDPKIAPSDPQPVTKKSTSTKKTAEAKTGSSNATLIALAVVVAAGGIFYWSTTRQKSKQAPVNALPRVEASQMAKVFLAPTPDSQVILSLNGETVFQGGTPAQIEVKAGLYKVQVENKTFQILEEADLNVEAGQSVRFEKVFLMKRNTVAAPAVAAPAQWPGPNGSIPMSPVEIEQKKSADQNKDPEAAYRFALSSLKRESFDVAYIYLAIAAPLGHGPAQFELGKLYFSRMGPPDSGLSFDASLYWLIKAALGGVKDATAFLAANKNKFPQEYSQNIENQRRIDLNDARAARLREGQLIFLEDLKLKLSSANLPN